MESNYTSPQATAPSLKPDSVDLLAYIFLASVALVVFWKAIFFPPRSDHWHAFYFFHEAGGGWKGMCRIAGYYLFDHFRFQPLSHLILYFSHSLFHSAHHFHNLLQIFLFIMILWLFYSLLKIGTQIRLVALLFALQFALTYTHFDLISWSYHMYILFGACCILLSVLFVKLNDSGKNGFWLILADLSLLDAMLSYEPFFGSAFAVIGGYAIFRKERRREILGHLFVVYFFYLFLFAIYVFTLMHRPKPYAAGDFLRIGHIARSLQIALTNFTYTNCILNFFPLIAYPPRLLPNALFVIGPFFTPLILILEKTWWIQAVVYAAILIHVIRVAKEKRAIVLPLAVTFLLASYLVILAVGRSQTDTSMYLYNQFRYQFFPNLLTDSLFALWIGTLLKKRKPLTLVGIVAFFGISLGFNAAATVRGLSMIDLLHSQQSRLVEEIREGIRLNQIGESQKFYIDPNLVFKTAPWNAASWNYPGTIEWLFNECEGCFAFNLEEGSLTLDEEFAFVPIKKVRR